MDVYLVSNLAEIVVNFGEVEVVFAQLCTFCLCA